jgi:hypothetical protein
LVSNEGAIIAASLTEHMVAVSKGGILLELTFKIL